MAERSVGVGRLWTRRRGIAAACCAATWLGAGAARAQGAGDVASRWDAASDARSSAAQPASDAEREVPTLPAGQPIPVDGERPAVAPGVVRSARAPIAVHGAPDVPADTLLAVRDAADAALRVYEREYRLPGPAPDGTRGGGSELDIYVVPGGAAASRTEVDALEPWALWDRASAFVVVRADLAPLERTRAVAEGVAQAVMLGIDAHAPRPWRLAVGAYLAAQATGLGPDLEALASFQRGPQAALIANRDDVSARGAALFVDYLVQRYDHPDLPLVRGLLWMPVAATPADAPRLADEPDVFDVMQRLFRTEPHGFERVLAEFHATRATVGTAGDTMDLAGGFRGPELAPDLVRTVRYAQLPAWVTPTDMLDKTGAAYVAIDTREAGTGAVNLWFHGVPWRAWSVDVLRLDASGRMVGRAPQVDVQRGEWSTVVEGLDRVARLLVVVVDLGNRDLDPDVPPDANGFFALNIAP